MKIRTFVLSISALAIVVSVFILPSRDSNKEESTLNTKIEAVEATEQTLLFGGDVMLSREIGAIMERRNDFAFPFARVASLMRKADLTIVNLEGPISDKGINQGSIYSFRANPRAVETLQTGGIDAVSLANNHIYDYGPEALLDTLANLTRAKIGFTGAGKDFASAHAPYIVLSKGVRFAFLSYTNLLPSFLGKRERSPAIALFNEAILVEDIQKAKEKADTVVVLFHFGEEYQLVHNAVQERMARMAIDEGATLVVGHHPHVPQDSEWYKGGFIAYSLGNLVFDQNFGDTKRGLLLEAKFKGKNLEAVHEIPIAFSANYEPYVVEGR